MKAPEYKSTVTLQLQNPDGWASFRKAIEDAFEPDTSQPPYVDADGVEFYPAKLRETKP